VCWPLLCVSRPFCILEKKSGFEPYSVIYLGSSHTAVSESCVAFCWELYSLNIFSPELAADYRGLTALLRVVLA
jgi:hypothetical protein